MKIDTWRFLRSRWPELIVLFVGIAARLLMLRNFELWRGYDYESHLPYVGWFSQHTSLPPLDLCRETYHPPLYYVLAGLALRLGVALPHMGLLAVVFGSLRLVLIWLGLTWLLPGARGARLLALLVAAVMPSSIHLDGMMTGEGLSNLLAAAAMLVALPLLRQPRPAHPYATAALLGVIVGLAMLTKISALVLIAALGGGAALQLALHGAGGWRGRAIRLAPWLLALLVATALAGWYFARNLRQHGKLFLSGFDGKDRRSVGSALRTPYLQRRPLSYFFGWSNDIYRWPYYPSAVQPHSYFFPQLVASTFVDFYNYGYAPSPPPGHPTVRANTKPLRRDVLLPSQLSVIGGTLLTIAVLAAWAAAFVHALRRRQCERAALLLVPLLALLGQLHFATAWPIDSMGMVKGLYMQFASPPLYALVGIAAAWLWSRFPPAALAIITSVGLIAVYAFYCRLI